MPDDSPSSSTLQTGSGPVSRRGPPAAAILRALSCAPYPAQVIIRVESITNYLILKLSYALVLLTFACRATLGASTFIAH
jgi:hypothetical protein